MDVDIAFSSTRERIDSKRGAYCSSDPYTRCWDVVSLLDLTVTILKDFCLGTWEVWLKDIHILSVFLLQQDSTSLYCLLGHIIQAADLDFTCTSSTSHFFTFTSHSYDSWPSNQYLAVFASTVRNSNPTCLFVWLSVSASYPKSLNPPYAHPPPPFLTSTDLLYRIDRPIAANIETR